MNIQNSKRSYKFIVVVYVLFIYITSPLMRPLLNFLKNKGGDLFGEATTFFLAILLFSLVGWMWLRLKLSWRKWGVVSLIVALYGLCFYLLPVPEERIHLLEYGFLSFLVYRVFHQEGGGYYVPAFSSFLGVSFFGAVDEIIQHFLPNRVGDIRDVFINAISGLLGLAIVLIIETALAQRKKVFQ